MKRVWWKEAIGYQIYPRSFKDSNNDGVGDLRGIISKLDYLKGLGIDVIWICPMYKSPNDDNGYDISDYQDIMEDFGTMKDFDDLLEEVHKRGMKLIIDLVINHTSDEHKWFIESKESKESEKRDWYIWRDGRDGIEPNNWESIFRGSAWECDEKTKQYYLHLFSKKQPDLNWENKDVRDALYSMINWWLDKGIDGFRVDAISHIKKEEGLNDMPNPNNEKYVTSFKKHMNVDGIHKYLEELKENTFDKYDIMTVGEANGVNAKDAGLWVGEEEGKFNMVFQFEHIKLWDYDKGEKLDIVEFKKILTKWQKALEGNGWNALYIENHDRPRAVSTWGCDKTYWDKSSKAFALNYFMQQGTPFIYQGQEIGMTNVKFNSIEEYNDIKSINLYKKKINEGASAEEAMKCIWAVSRDNSRTPMQWDSSVYGGFSKQGSWIGCNENYKNINVESQLNDKASILSFYKKLIKLRKDNLGLVYGIYDLILDEHKEIYAYTRTFGEEKYIVICNLSDKVVQYSYDDITLKSSNLLISNYEVDFNVDSENSKEYKDMTSFEMKPYESRMYKY